MVTIWPITKWLAGVERPGREANNLPKSSTNVKNEWHAQGQPSQHVQVTQHFFLWRISPSQRHLA